jgi:hypothetical protein
VVVIGLQFFSRSTRPATKFSAAAAGNFDCSQPKFAAIFAPECADIAHGGDGGGIDCGERTGLLRRRACLKYLHCNGYDGGKVMVTRRVAGLSEAKSGAVNSGWKLRASACPGVRNRWPYASCARPVP